MLDGRYRLEDQIGEGGFARVYRATDVVLGRRVAVKVFTVAAPDARDAQRRMSETRLLAALSHPSLVTLFDARLDRDPSFLVMELIDGPTLRALLSDGPMDAATAATLAVELAEALEVIHAAGVVHRDIKPSNVLLRPPAIAGRSARATLADFGIAALVDTTGVTATGTLVGTAAYLSPEQARGTRAGSASDVYSLGLLLVEALTAERAFSEQTPQEALAARVLRSPTIPAHLPADWRGLLSAMTALDPAHRPDAAAVQRAAARLGGGSGSAAPTASPAASPTVIAPHPTPVGTARTAATAVMDPDAAPRPVRRRKRARWAWGLGAIVVVATAAALGTLLIPGSAAPEPAPSFPVLPEPLATHFDDLWSTL